MSLIQLIHRAAVISTHAAAMPRNAASTEEPELRRIGEGQHFVSCHFAEQLNLRGVMGKG